ncbi:MAG: hypothetical protein UX81_C0009G0009 [Parcubacteria group bacterium GW2011_GWA2_47_12]|nr:MAG: hypothetical protein UX81_C0009G0009 [Parcubacteria group bacterium GW2011_GWA2_47_12]
MTLYRILAIIVLLVSTTVSPHPITLALAALGIFLFPRFWEAVACGVFLDALYSVSEARWFGFQFIYTVITLVLIVVIEQLKKSLRWYSRN